MITIAIVSGGYTAESVISFKSADLIYNQLPEAQYRKYHVRILKDEWYVDLGEEKIPINKANFSFTHQNQTIYFDLVYNIIHGTPGEDGILQAYWQSIGVKFSGCGFYASALTFNKKDCLAVLDKYNIHKAKSFYLRKGESYNLDNIIATVGLPCFVKPNQSGSSLGISKVYQKEDFSAALDFAFAQDKEVLVESFLDGTEVSVGVVQHQNKPIVLGITEIVSETDFFDYQAKYHGKSKEITPARITNKQRKSVEDAAIKIYKKLNLSGFTRSDFILVEDQAFFIEVNTIPGMSPESILPQQAHFANLAIADLLDEEVKRVLNESPNI